MKHHMIRRFPSMIKKKSLSKLKKRVRMQERWYSFVAL